MTKIHPIEKCIWCGQLIAPLKPDNNNGLDGLHNLVVDFKAKSLSKNTCLSIITSIGCTDKKANIVYFLCASCCRYLLEKMIISLVTERKEILLRKFDKIKEEPK